jgi:AcrR family transcriptional regulator
MTTHPAVKRPRARRKAAGRFHHGDLAEQLARGAADLVERHGHHAFSLRELARRLGVTQPAIYRHYPDRDALLAEVALRGFEQLIGELSIPLQSAVDPCDAALTFGRTYVRFAAAHPGWFRLQFSREWNEVHARRPEVLARFGPAADARLRFLEVLKHLLPAGDDRVADLYRLVWSTAHGLASLVVERVFQLVQTDHERIAAADVALGMLVDALRAWASAAPGPAVLSPRWR